MIAHRCPICLGQQTVEKGYYDAKNDGGCLSWMASTTGEREMCRTCLGRGMVWEPESPVRIEQATSLTFPRFTGGERWDLTLT